MVEEEKFVWKQKVLEMRFKEREGGTITEGLRKAVPEFGGHGHGKTCNPG